MKEVKMGMGRRGENGDYLAYDVFWVNQVQMGQNIVERW